MYDEKGDGERARVPSRILENKFSWEEKKQENSYDSNEWDTGKNTYH